MSDENALTSITGLGVDIVEIERMERILERSVRFTQRVFSEGERIYCEGKSRPAVHYALRFAAKEAVLKALGTGFSEGVGFCDVEVENDEKGKPIPILHGRAAQIADEQGIIEIHLSLTRTQGTAVANAIAATEGSKTPPPEEKPDPKRQLAEAFKELRGMLDELEREEVSGDESIQEDERDDIDASVVEGETTDEVDDGNSQRA